MSSDQRIEIALALVHFDGRWLVARRPGNVHLPNVWEFPGGKLQADESAEDAAVRELWEECGVRAAPERALPAIQHTYPDRTVRLTPIICRWLSGDAQALASEECRWVTAAELTSLEMPAANAALIENLVRYENAQLGDP